MILNKQFDVYPTHTYKKELSNIIHYLKHELKELLIAKEFYDLVIKRTLTLSFMPERHSRIYSFNNISRNLRKIYIGNYIVIYEVNNDLKKVFLLHIFHNSQNYFNKL